MKKITLTLIIILSMYNVNAQIQDEDTTLQHFNDGSTSLQISYVDCSNILTDISDLIYLVQIDKLNNGLDSTSRKECLDKLYFINNVFMKEMIEKDKIKTKENWNKK